jgi:regulator of sigma E protease
MNTIVSFAIVLGLLIFVHEFGHFLWAKMFGVKVLKFSLGFGPKIAGRRFGETEYVLSAFPLGGYVKMFGEAPGEEEEIPVHERNRSFVHKPLWQRFIIVAGGPVFNLIFAVFLFFLIFSIAGIPEPVESTAIGGVNPGSPAAAAGLKPGDTILAINSAATTRWEEVSEHIRESGGQEVSITVARGSEHLTLQVRPRMEKVTNIFGEKVGERLMIGISRSEEVVYEKVSWTQAAKAGLVQTWNFMYLTIVGLIKIIQKVIPASELGGPILIAQLAGQQMKAGWENFLFFMGLISVNLGILNLLPIPILDGGHLVFFSVEAILRRPLSLRTMEMMQQIGLVILGTLMIFVFYNDLLRLFG